MDNRETQVLTTPSSSLYAPTIVGPFAKTPTMANILFSALAPTEVTADDGFRAGRPVSVFVNGLTIVNTGYQLGRWSGIQQDEHSVSILLNFGQVTQAGDPPTELTEGISVNRFLRKQICFDSEGRLKAVSIATFGDDLRAHIEKLGRRPDNDQFVNGSPDEVAKHIMKFFEGKTIICTLLPDLFGKDKGGRLYQRNLIQFSFA